MTIYFEKRMYVDGALTEVEPDVGLDCNARHQDAAYWVTNGGSQGPLNG